jgi:hypothetical protein
MPSDAHQPAPSPTDQQPASPPPLPQPHHPFSFTDTATGPASAGSFTQAGEQLPCRLRRPSAPCQVVLGTNALQC